MFEYRAHAINVVDGDTFDAVIKLSDESQVLATVIAPDRGFDVQTLSDVTTDFGFRITEQRIVTLEPDPEIPGLHIVERRIKRREDRIRLYGIDTPERGDPGYTDATVALRSMVMGSDLIVRSVKPHDKYGRWLATIETRTVPDVAQALIDAGLGRPYHGEAKP